MSRMGRPRVAGKQGTHINVWLDKRIADTIGDLRAHWDGCSASEAIRRASVFAAKGVLPDAAIKGRRLAAEHEIQEASPPGLDGKPCWETWAVDFLEEGEGPSLKDVEQAEYYRGLGMRPVLMSRQDWLVSDAKFDQIQGIHDKLVMAKVNEWTTVRRAVIRGARLVLRSVKDEIVIVPECSCRILGVEVETNGGKRR